MSRAKLAHLMDAETWMNANKAIELGFADGVLEDEKKQATRDDVVFSFSRRAVTNSLLNKVQRKQASKAPAEEPPPAQTTEPKYPVEPLYQRLSLISH
jgi:ATP-dependent Clp protease protease subunit